MRPQIQLRETADSENLISAPRLLERHGISQMSLWRRLRDPRLSFPQPLVIAGRRYLKLGEIRDWEERQVSRSQGEKSGERDAPGTP